MNMNVLWEIMLDLYNQAGGGLSGIDAIQNFLHIENRYRSDDEKLSLKEVADALGLEDEYDAYQLVKGIGEDIC